MTSLNAVASMMGILFCLANPASVGATVLHSPPLVRTGVGVPVNSFLIKRYGGFHL